MLGAAGQRVAVAADAQRLGRTEEQVASTGPCYLGAGLEVFSWSRYGLGTGPSVLLRGEL